MENYSQNNSKTSEEDRSYAKPNENEELSKLKMEGFHLRLRCYNLEEQLKNCICSEEENEIQKDFFDHRTQLNKVVHSHQELKWENERLSEENRLLTEKCSGINDDFEKKLSDYENLKVKCNDLTLLVKDNESIPSTVTKIMNDNDDLIKINIERKLKIRHLEKKLAAMNNSFIEDESQRRISLTKSLVKMLAGPNDNSFQNTSTLLKQCIQCDELKVYTDKLSETVIKMTIDFQGLNKTMEQKNYQIADLEQQVLTLNTTPDVDQEQLHKYKVIAKQCMRRLLKEKESKEELTKLIDFYVKEQGQYQFEIENLKNLNSGEANKSEKIGKLFLEKLSEIQESQVHVMKSINLSHGNLCEYDQVGQYSPQYKIRTDLLNNSSMISDTDSVYYDRNVSLNATAFNAIADDSLHYEANIKEGIQNMQQKIQELGEVVKNYVAMKKDGQTVPVCAKNDKSTQMVNDDAVFANTLNWTNEITDNNNSDIRDTKNSKRINKEEKERLESLLDEKVLEIEILQQNLKDTTATHKEAIENLSLTYTTNTAKYHQKVKQLKDSIETLENTEYYQNETILKLENTNKELEDKLTENHQTFSDKLAELEKEIESLCRDNYDAKEIILLTNDSFVKKLDEMELIFNRVKSITEDQSLLFPLDSIDKDAHSMDIKYIFEMLKSIETVLREKSSNVVTLSKSVQYLSDSSECLEQSSNALKDSLNSVSNVSQRSGSHLHDLTNVTNLTDLTDLEIPKMNEVYAKDRFKYIRENPEKIHRKMKYFYETCMMLKSAALKEHEENKGLKNVHKALMEMSKQLDDIKRQLGLCHECLPDAVAKELRELNMM